MHADSVFGAQDQINFGSGLAFTQDNTARLHSGDGDSYVGGSKDSVTYFGDGASASSSKSRVSMGAGNDSLFLGAGNFGVNLGADSDLLSAGSGSGSSFVDVYGGTGADRFTLGVTGDHDVLVRDFCAAEGDTWGFRTSGAIGVTFGTGNIGGVDVFTATYANNTFSFNAATTDLAAIQASCLNTLI